MRIRTLVGLAVTPLLAVGVALPTMAASAASTPSGQNGTTLSASVTAGLSQDKTYGWTLTKTADPASQNIWLGDSAKVTWTVGATRDAGQLGDVKFAGKLTIVNGGDVATDRLNYTINLERKVPGGNTWELVGAPLGVNPAEQIAAHSQATYDFGWAVQGYQPGTYRVEVPVVIYNHSGHLNAFYGPTPKADVGYQLREVNGTLHVTDTNGQAWDFAATGSQSYDQTVKPDKAGEQVLTNTASAQGVADTTATAKVTAYGLDVAKTAQAAGFTRTYKWALGDPVLSGDKPAEGQDGSYSVAIKVTHVDSDYQVTGTVTIKNDSPLDASGITVTDTLPGVQFDKPLPTDLPKGQEWTANFTYSPQNGDNGTNEVDVALSNGTVFKGTADWTFKDVKPTKEVDKTADIHNIATITGHDTQAQGQGSDQQLQVTDP